MIKHKQLNYHRPEDGIYGDCQRTVFACLLDLEPTDIPNFGDLIDKDGAAFRQATKAWLASRGYVEVHTAWTGTVQSVLESQKIMNPGVFYMISGLSATGCNHVVIGLDDQIYWDTSRNNSGLVGPCDDGYFWISWLLPQVVHLCNMDGA